MPACACQPIYTLTAHAHVRFVPAPSNVMLNATCCVTLGYLIIDSAPLGNLQALSKDPDAKEYHMFHMLIAVGRFSHVQLVRARDIATNHALWSHEQALHCTW